MIKLCMFDLDGTTADTLDDLTDAMNYALKKHGFAPHDRDAYRYFVGSGIWVLIQRASLCEDDKVIAEIKSDFDKYYAEHSIDKTRAYDGCRQMLDNLKNEGIACGIFSNKPHQFIDRILDKLYPGYEFICALGKQDGFERKPDPTVLLRVMQDFGIRNDECIYIGDSNVDVQTAKNANVKCIGVDWGFRGKDELINEGADFIVSSPHEIFDTVMRLNSTDND